MAHLDDLELAAFFDQSAGAVSRDRVLNEIAHCAECRRLVAALARDWEFDGAVGDPLARYELRDFIGSGAWGSVYRAHDPTLGRDVAIKLVSLKGHDAQLGVQLRREGRLLARAAHPNVVRIFDAIQVGGDVALVMELVAGGTLAAWLETGPDDASIVRAFCGAGRGLAAAHRAGVIHGDFKPRNVLIDGSRVVVADFGLGHVEGTPEKSEVLGSLDQPVWGGTRAYLAPERIKGGRATAESDQYAFGVALSSAFSTVPRHLRRPLRRLRAPMPGARFASMDEAVDALESTRRRLWPALGFGSALVVGALLAPIAGSPSASVPPLQPPREYDSDDPRRQVLDDAREWLSQQQYQAVLDALDLQFDFTHTEHTEEWALAANYAAKAHGMLGNSDEHTRLSSEVVTVAVEVGHSGLAAEATLGLLQARLNQTYTPEVRTLLRTAEAYAQRAVDEPGSDPGDLRILLEVELAKAALAAGDQNFEQALASLSPAIDRVRAQLGPDSLLLGRMLEFRSKVRLHLGRIESARLDAEHALNLYERVRGGDAVELAEPLRILMHLASAAGELDRALAYADRSVELRERSLGRQSLLLARALKARGGMHAILRDFGAAERDLSRALAIFEGSANVEIDVCDTLMNLARVRSWQDTPTEAIRLLERAVVLAEGAGRADIVARADVERCRIYLNAGDHRRARTACSAADHAYVELFGPKHPVRTEIEELRRQLTKPAQPSG